MIEVPYSSWTIPIERSAPLWVVSIQGDRADPQSPRPRSHEADSRLEVVDDRGEVGEPVRTTRGCDDIDARRVHARTDSDLGPIVRRRLAEQSDHHGSGARKPPPPSLLGPPRYAMPTVLEHHADQRPTTPQVPREEVRKDPPGCAALGSAAAAEHEHLGPPGPPISPAKTRSRRSCTCTTPTLQAPQRLSLKSAAQQAPRCCSPWSLAGENLFASKPFDQLTKLRVRGGEGLLFGDRVCFHRRGFQALGGRSVVRTPYDPPGRETTTIASLRTRIR